ncbi:MAG: M14 family zinc carboxypeptidase [Actinomycetes bacterium]
MPRITAVAVALSVFVGASLAMPASSHAEPQQPLPTAPPAPVAPPFADGHVVLGTTSRGRAIVAERQGDPAATRVVLAVGQMHGNEPKGQLVIRALRGLTPPANTQIWSIMTMNPDGAARGSRTNARGVDLNRNFPSGWSRRAAGAGRSPASERETKMMMAFIAALRPDAVLSFHQPLNTIMSICTAESRPWVTRIASTIRLAVNPAAICSRYASGYSGTMNQWFSANQRGWFATIELPASRLVNSAMAYRAATAITALAADVTDR